VPEWRPRRVAGDTGIDNNTTAPGRDQPAEDTQSIGGSEFTSRQEVKPLCHGDFEDNQRIDRDVVTGTEPITDAFARSNIDPEDRWLIAGQIDQQGVGAIGCCS